MIPTPRDIARRTAAPQFTEPVPQPAVTPPPAAVPAQSTPFRLKYERAIRRSSLPANARLVGLTVATYAEFTTGVIPPAAYPSLATIAKAAGIPPSLTRQCLHTLALGGWIRQTPPPRKPEFAPGRTELLLPARASTTAPGSTVH